MSRPVPTVRVLPTDHPTLTWEINCSACGFVATGHPFERFQANRVASEHRERHRHERHDKWACCLVLLVAIALLIGLALLAAYGARP